MAVRTARISSIDYAQGTAQVTSRCGRRVSADYPMLAGTYRALSVGDTVQVLEDATGRRRGVILGKAYSQKNPPPEGSAGLFRVDMGDGIYMRQQGGTLTIDATGKNLTIKCGTIDITADAGEITVNGIPMTAHKHTETAGNGEQHA